MPDITDLLSLVPVDDVARRLGVPPDQARQMVGQAVPSLLSGMEANAREPGGASSLAAALGQHAPRGVAGLADDGDAEGRQIVDHIFGSNGGQVADRLGGLLGGDGGGGLMGRLLPMLAPMVLSWVAKELTGSDGPDRGFTGNSGKIAGVIPGDTGGGPGGSGGDDLLGSLGLGDLGGGGSGGGLAGMLGSLIRNELTDDAPGGGSGAGGGNELGDLLGDLLGGGTKG